MVLVRHGESEWNAAGILQGHLGPGLTPLGRAQADATAELLARTRGEPALIARSDLPRAVETAAPVERRYPHVEVVVDERLREVDLGTWAGRRRAEVAAAEPEAMAAWDRGEDVRRGGGETFAEVQVRMVAALADLAARAPGQARRGVAGGLRPPVVYVFSHGGPIRVAVAATLGIAGRDGVLAEVANCAVSEIAHLGDGSQLVSYNAVEHLAELATAGAVDDRRRG